MGKLSVDRIAIAFKMTIKYSRIVEQWRFYYKHAPHHLQVTDPFEINTKNRKKMFQPLHIELRK